MNYKYNWLIATCNYSLYHQLINFRFVQRIIFLFASFFDRFACCLWAKCNARDGSMNVYQGKVITLISAAHNKIITHFYYYDMHNNGAQLFPPARRAVFPMMSPAICAPRTFYLQF